MTVEELNDRFQVIKKNKYWNEKNPMLFEISSKLDREVNFDNRNIPNVSDYLIENIDINQMKNIVYNFFININPGLETRLNKILENINISNEVGRSYANNEGINFHYDNSLSSLITLAHEVSHRIASMNYEGNVQNDKKIGEFSEVEAELTEEMFLNYLKNNNLEVTLDGERTNIDDEIINNIRLNKMNSVMQTVYRSEDELSFKNLLNNGNLSKIDGILIRSIAKSTNMSEENVINRINNVIDNYYPHNGEEVVDGYDLHNGKQLSNEARFIYAHLFASKLDEMNLDEESKREFYSNYLDNAKNMSFEDMLNTFNVDMENPLEITDSFVNVYENMISKNESKVR